jgi:hypothetical protein
MNIIGTPNNLDILMHFYTSGSPHPRRDAPAVKEGIDYLMRTGMLQSTTEADVWAVTEKALVYIDYIMKVSFPTQSWKMP